jgi:hypothetical protein
MNGHQLIKTLIQPSFFQRILKIEPKENALVEVNNLLVCKPTASIEETEITAISEKYKVNLRKKFLVGLKDLYRNNLLSCLADNM